MPPTLRENDPPLLLPYNKQQQQQQEIPRRSITTNPTTPSTMAATAASGTMMTSTILSSGATAAKPRHPTGPLENAKFKAKLCRTFERTGNCPYQDKCQFAHGQRELEEWNAQREMIGMLQKKLETSISTTATAGTNSNNNSPARPATSPKFAAAVIAPTHHSSLQHYASAPSAMTVVHMPAPAISQGSSRQTTPTASLGYSGPSFFGSGTAAAARDASLDAYERSSQSSGSTSISQNDEVEQQHFGRSMSATNYSAFPSRASQPSSAYVVPFAHPPGFGSAAAIVPPSHVQGGVVPPTLQQQQQPLRSKEIGVENLFSAPAFDFNSLLHLSGIDSE